LSCAAVRRSSYAVSPGLIRSSAMPETLTPAPSRQARTGVRGLLSAAPYPEQMRRGALLLGVLAALVLGLGSPVAGAATPTGNLLVLLDQTPTGAAGGSVSSLVQTALAQLGARPAGRSVPEIGLLTVRPPRGAAAAVFERAVAGFPGVASVAPELRYVPRAIPDDPALSTREPGTSVDWQWYLRREHFPAAWGLSQGRGALVGVIDTGIDATHPELASKLAATVDQQARSDSTGPAGTDQVGHGTHVASLACADTGNAVGIAGAGYDCRLVIEKTDFTDSSIAASIIDATKRHVDALNMSFGPSGGGSESAPRSEVRSLDYAARHRVVLVAAAADSPGTEQGDPANVLQPAGTGPHLDEGIGLDVTAADYKGNRASFAGSGTEISLSAYGALSPSGNVFSPCNGRTFGILGAFPANSTEMESFPPTACRVSFQGDNRYATIAGTSMAAPQVAATAAMMRVLNPYATLQDILRTVKRTASRPPRNGWRSNLGWGILNAGAALQAIRRVDRLAPQSTLSAPKVAHSRSFELRWSGQDQQRPGLIASGIAYFKVWMRTGAGPAVLLLRTTRHRVRFTGLPGHRYTFWTVAVDRAGNHQRRIRPVTTLVV
jgi:serine protease